jgi:small subunit ribosomal protein S20
VANHRSAIKRHKQSLQRRDRNRAIKTRVKNSLKGVHAAVENKDKDQAQRALGEATSVLDRAATKRVIHWRNASRRVSRLTRKVNALD